MNWKALIALLIIIASLFPVYLINKYLQNKIRPKESLSRLFLYMLSGMCLVFFFTAILVFIIKWLFREEYL